MRKKIRFAVIFAVVLSILCVAVVSMAAGNGAYNYGDGIWAGLMMRLSTRSGPGTDYDEPGTFFQNTWQKERVRVLGKSWDGSIWWVFVEFQNGQTAYRAWTGLKRVNVNIDAIPEVYSIGQGTVDATETRRGPGSYYAKGPTISRWKDVVAYAWENGYVEVEFFNDADNMIYRCWVPESKVSIDLRSEQDVW